MKKQLTIRGQCPECKRNNCLLALPVERQTHRMPGGSKRCGLICGRCRKEWIQNMQDAHVTHRRQD